MLLIARLSVIMRYCNTCTLLLNPFYKSSSSSAQYCGLKYFGAVHNENHFAFGSRSILSEAGRHFLLLHILHNSSNK